MTISTIDEPQRKAARVRKAARIAGFTFLFYIAAGIASMVLFSRATSGEGIAAKLAGISEHAMEMRILVLF